MSTIDRLRGLNETKMGVFPSQKLNNEKKLSIERNKEIFLRVLMLTC
jgi:hypothetical protein